MSFKMIDPHSAPPAELPSAAAPGLALRF